MHSDPVIAICKGTEKLINRYLVMNLAFDKHIKQKIVLQILQQFFDVFDNLNNEYHNLTCNDNHELLLIRAVAEQYISVRLHHVCRNFNERERIRTYFKKIILFKGD